MTVVNYRKMSVANGETRYADPGDVTHTVRVNVTTAPKSAGAVSLTNVKVDYVENEQGPVTNGTDNAKEALSIRISSSGSTQSAEARKARIAQAFENYLALLDDQALLGFMPEVPLVVHV